MKGSETTSAMRSLQSWIALLAVAALISTACGADVDDSGTDAADDGDSISRAAGTLVDPNLTVIIEAIEGDFGTLGSSQEAALADLVAEGPTACSDVGGPRARTQVSQIEVEIIRVVDGCLRFSYDVAGFRTLVADIRTFRQEPDVIAVSPLLLEYRLNQFDFDSQDAAWPVDVINASAIIDSGQAPTGSDVVVAIIDSGVDTEHPTMRGITVARAPGSGQGDYTQTGHGTIAAALMISPIGEAPRAVAPGITVLDVPADLCGMDGCGCAPCAPMTPAEAIRWSVDNDADILSMSFGYQPAPKPAWWQLLLDDDEIASTTETIEVALAYAALQGVAMSAAAGNCAVQVSSRCEVQHQYEIPAGHSAVIGVGALSPGEDGEPIQAAYSTQQSYVELSAPGEVIIVSHDGEPLARSGTSFSTPFVSASLALLIGSDGPLAGYSNRHQIARQILRDSAADIEPEGRDDATGFGRLQLEQALLAATDYASENPPPTPTPTSGP